MCYRLVLGCEATTEPEESKRLACCMHTLTCSAAVDRIPSEDPSGHSMVLPQQQFMEIQQRAIVESKEERQALLQQAKLAKLDAMVSVRATLWKKSYVVIVSWYMVA